MKNQKMTSIFFLSILLCLTIQTFGQKDKNKISIPFDDATQKYTYVKVIEAPNKTAADLYATAKDWTKIKYTHEKYLFDTKDEQLTDLGNFSINVLMKAGMMKVPYVYTIIFNINFLFKEGKYKLEIANIKLSGNAQGTTGEMAIEAFQKQSESTSMGKKYQVAFMHDVFTEIDVNMLKLIAEIEAAMKDGVKSKTEW